MARYTPYRSVRPVPRERRILLVITAFIVFLVFADLVTGGIVRSAVHRSSSLVSSLAQKAGVPVSGGDFYQSKSQMRAQIQHLQDEVLAYRAKDFIYKAMNDENVQLRKMTHLVEEAPGITA